MSTNPELPAFAEWLQWQARERGLTPAPLARLLGLPKPTVATLLSGRTKRPGLDIAQRIAVGLGYPRMALAVAAGYGDRTELGQAEESAWLTTMPWIAGLNPAQRSSLWSRLGQETISALSESVSQAVAQERWKARGVANVMTDILGLGRGDTDAGFFDAIPGSALALVVEGAGGTPAALLAVAAVMGRLGPGLCGVWGCAMDWESWSQAAGPLLKTVDGHIERFDAQGYLAACRGIDWTVSRSAPEPSTADQAEDPDLLSAVWPRLNPSQKSVVHALLKSWNL